MADWMNSSCQWIFDEWDRTGRMRPTRLQRVLSAFFCSLALMGVGREAEANTIQLEGTAHLGALDGALGRYDARDVKRSQLNLTTDYPRLLLVFGGADIFGLGNLWVGYDRDPLLVFRYELTSYLTTDEYFTFDTWGDTDITNGPTNASVYLSLELIDTNGDGSVAITSGFANARVLDTDNFAFGNLYVDYAGFSLSGEGEHVLADFSEATGPEASALNTSSLGFNQLEWLINGNLSAGDSVIINAFACYHSAGGSCVEPYRIESVAAPVPSAMGLFVSGLGLLAGVGARSKRATAGSKRTQNAAPARRSASRAINPCC